MGVKRHITYRGWSGGAMVLSKLSVPGRPTIWITVGQGWGCLDIFTLIYPFFPLSPSLWETARYRLKYCLKGPLNPKPTNQPTLRTFSCFCEWNVVQRFLTINYEDIVHSVPGSCPHSLPCVCLCAFRVCLCHKADQCGMHMY